MELHKEELKKELQKERSLPHKIAVDILGILLIIASLLFGWLPGPGGMPLFLAGMGLLASNHLWAKQLLNWFKQKGAKLFNIIFNDNPYLIIIYDVLSVCLIVFAGIVINKFSGNLIQGVAIMLIFLGIGLFISNRKRISTINKFVEKIKNKT